MEVKNIMIDGKPFSYFEEDNALAYENLGEISVADAKNLLLTTKKLLDQKNMKFCLAFGTLLGAVRDKGIIKGDEDVDIYVDNEKELLSIIPFLYENGLKVCRIIPHVVYSFRLNDRSYIDIYFKAKCKVFPWLIWCDKLYNKVVPRVLFNETEEIAFLGEKFLCPKDPENALAFWYGEDWRTPVRGHAFIYEVKSFFLFNKYFFKPLKNTIKHCIGYKYWKH